MKELFFRYGFILLVLMLAASSLPVWASETADVVVTIAKCFNLEVHGSLDYYPVLSDYLDEPDNYDPPYDWDDQGYGWTDPDSVSCWIWANWPWKLQVRGVEDEFDETTGFGWQNKPREDILWMDGVGDPFHELTGSFVTVATGPVPSGPPYDGNGDSYYSINVPFRILLKLAWDSPGIYEYEVEFTLGIQ